MAKTVETGIIITAKNATGAGFKAAEAGAKSFGNAVKGMAVGAGKALKAVGVAGALMNQTLELGRKAAELFRMTIGASISKALEFRKATDPQVKALDALRHGFEVLSARIGDVFIPILAGLSDGMRPIIDELTNWINTNKVLIGTNIINWVESFARALVKGLAYAANLASKAYGALERGIMRVVKFGYEAAAVFTQLKEMDLDAGEKFLRSATEMDRAIKQSAQSTEDFEEKLLSFQSTAESVIGRTAVAMHRRLQQATSSSVVKTEELRAAEERLSLQREERVSQVNSRILGQIEAKHQAEIMNLSLQEDLIRAEEARMAELEQGYKATAQTIGQTLGSVFRELFTGAMSVEDAMKMILLQAAKMATSMIIMQLMGGGIAGGLGAGLFGGLMGFRNGGFVPHDGVPIRGYADGGFVTGGTPNRDSVPIMAMPGERVQSLEEVHALRRFFSDMGGSMGGAQGVTVNVSTTVPSDRGHLERTIRDAVLPAMRGLQRKRQLRLT